MKLVEVNASRAYEVKIAAGLLDAVGAEVRAVTSGSVLVVTDENVAPLYLARVYRSLSEAGLRVATCSVPAGEHSKSIENYVNLLHILAEKRFTRTDAVLALGGGVVGDLAGFAAATYLRGLPFIQVPTTLLAMVDSSVGGKTAVDIPQGKNLVGAFHQPSLVLCDPSLLDTLPPEVFRDGCAEVIKTAILFDRDLFDHLRERGTDFDRERVITRCVEHKRDVVCADEFDTGARQLLNLGHTIGHAIEAVSGFSVSHGCAVAIGTAMMARTFYADPAEIEAVFLKFGLPISTDFSAEMLANAALSDKKRAGDTLTLVVPREIGACTLEKIPVSRLQAVIEGPLTLPHRPIGGTIRAIASKSQAHRLLICAAFSDRATEIACAERSRDIDATAACLSALGAEITYANGAFTVHPCRKPPKTAHLDCGESGSTLRFLLPVAAALGVETTFSLHGKLPERPLSPLWEELERHGCTLSRPTKNTVRCAGRLSGGTFRLAGNISSQFISGLLFALPLTGEASDIMLTTPLESAGYVELTIAALNDFEIRVEEGLRIPAQQSFRAPERVSVEGDWSNAAFWLCAGAISAPVTVTGLNRASAQGDCAILDLLVRFGAEVKWENDALTVLPRPLHGIEINARDIPDLVPPLALLAACAEGTTRITGAERLRIKESDRLQSIADALNALGGSVEILPDGLRIHGGRLTGGTVDSQNDHRIAMLAGIASARCRVTVRGAEAVEKSYPRFWEALSAMRKEENHGK